MGGPPVFAKQMSVVNPKYRGKIRGKYPRKTNGKPTENTHGKYPRKIPTEKSRKIPMENPRDPRDLVHSKNDTFILVSKFININN